MKCDQCKYHFELHGKRWCDRHETFISDDVSSCYVGERRDLDDEDELKPITNYDRIISKTREELARWMWAVQSGIKHEDIVSTYGWLDWLKQEAK